MRRLRFLWPTTLALALVVSSGGCILIPEMEDRVVELAVGGASSAVFTVQGTNTVVDETLVANGAGLDLGQILNEAGIDVSQVTNIALAGVSYRILRADPDPSRELTNGTVTIQRGSGPVTNLVTSLTAAPGVESDFQNVPLDPAGVAVIEQLLDDMLAALPGVPANANVTLHLTGNSSSAGGQPTDFDFELKLTISVTGTVTVRVPT